MMESSRPEEDENMEGNIIKVVKSLHGLNKLRKKQIMLQLKV